MKYPVASNFLKEYAKWESQQAMLKITDYGLGGTFGQYLNQVLPYCLNKFWYDAVSILFSKQKRHSFLREVGGGAGENGCEADTEVIRGGWKL